MVKILAIGAHNDEIMWDMGGVADILRQKGCEQLFVGLACQWNAELSADKKARYRSQEFAAAKTLGGEFVALGNREDYLFIQDKESIDRLVDLILDFKPDIAFIHFPKDNHIEHRESAQVAYKALCAAHVRGFGVKEVYAFEGANTQTSDYFSPDFLVDVGDSVYRVKQSLLCFDQNYANGAGLARSYELHRAYRAQGVKCKYAEAFKFIKFPDGSDDILLKKLLGDKFLWKGNGHYPAFGELFF